MLRGRCHCAGFLTRQAESGREEMQRKHTHIGAELFGGGRELGSPRHGTVGARDAIYHVSGLAWHGIAYGGGAPARAYWTGSLAMLIKAI
jgi:hypothetical protein